MTCLSVYLSVCLCACMAIAVCTVSSRFFSHFYYLLSFRRFLRNCNPNRLNIENSFWRRNNNTVCSSGAWQRSLIIYYFLFQYFRSRNELFVHHTDSDACFADISNTMPATERASIRWFNQRNIYNGTGKWESTESIDSTDTFNASRTTISWTGHICAK